MWMWMWRIELFITKSQWVPIFRSKVLMNHIDNWIDAHVHARESEVKT